MIVLVYLLMNLSRRASLNKAFMDFYIVFCFPFSFLRQLRVKLLITKENEILYLFKQTCTFVCKCIFNSASSWCGKTKGKSFPLPVSWRNWRAAVAAWPLVAAWTALPRVRMIELHVVWLWQSSRSEVTLCLLSMHGKTTEVPYAVSNIWDQFLLYC